MISPLNPKAKFWLDGRVNLLQKIKNTVKGPGEILWMHCSSLGEFEQGKPVLEKLRNENPTVKILLTFFSPSGYEESKDYQGADYIFYLPMDGAETAKTFFNIINPKLILFVKYEFWYYYLAEAKSRNIPLVLISGIFRKDQPFFKWYGSLHKNMLLAFTQIFVQNENSAALLQSIGFSNNVTIVGDTRFDRVIEIAEKFENISLIDQFVAASNVIVAGSTWLEDDEELDHFANTNPHLKFIVAPHNVGNDRIDECKKLYKNSVLFSELNSQAISIDKNVLIIDNIGMLSRLYKYATICYVGGAFGDDGVHNVLEPAVYGKPVVFGPEYEKYVEAEELIETGGGFSIENALELEELFNRLLQQNDLYLSSCKGSKEYVYRKSGSSDAIVNYIQANRLLTN